MWAQVLNLDEWKFFAGFILVKGIL